MKWTKEERRILRHKEAEPIINWMEDNYLLDGPSVSEPGPYRFSRSPYFKGIAEAFETTKEVVVRKSAQCGYSVFFVGLISYIIDNAPSDMLLVFPNADSGGNFLEEKVYPSFRKQKWLKKLLPNTDKDFTRTGITLANCSIHLGYSGSPTSLSSRSIRYIFADELSKFQSNNREADPVSLMGERQITFGSRSRLLYGTTPTHSEDNISKLFDSAGEQYYYHIPCPHCNNYYKPETKLIKWNIPEEWKDTAIRRERFILENDCVHLECPKCLGKITEEMRIRSLEYGIWLALNQWITANGEIVGEENEYAQRKAFQINRLMTPWGTLVAHAVEFQRSIGDPNKIRNFTNAWEGLPFKHISREITSNDIQQYCNATTTRREMTPLEGFLVASADTQDNSFHWSIWQIGISSAHIVDYGVAQDQQTLKEAVFKDFGGKVPQILAIDARGHRTSDIYQFASQDERIICVLGGNNEFYPPFKKTATADYRAKAYTIDTIFYKDKLYSWLENGKVTTFINIDDYWYRSIAAEKKISYMVGAKVKWRYEEVVKDKNHQLDCFVYAMFAYDYLSSTTNSSQYTAPKPKRIIAPVNLVGTNIRRF